MTIQEIFNNKATKPKEKTETLGQSLLEKKIKIDDLITFAHSQKDPIKATCMEAIEFATKTTPEIANDTCFDFAITGLAEKAPRIVWESTRVIGNTVHLFSNKFDKVVPSLLKNTNHSGTVVRWSTAFALSQVLKTGTEQSKKLIPQIKVYC
jgi:hypothetical protein